MLPILRDEHARRLRDGRCAAQFDQAGDVSGRRGRGRDPVGPRTISARREATASDSQRGSFDADRARSSNSW